MPQLLFALIILALCYLFFRLGQSQKGLDLPRPQRKPRRERARGDYHYITFDRYFFQNGKSEKRVLTVQVPGSLMRELDALTRERATSERLIVANIESHPGRRGRWYVQKAIHDLERDRH